ncbi:hypothetical protein [Naumannella cuiyingiana]|uniref:Uncharacterized protein n=1 Tax=Naumannella cuiyingiana TaxID=1347891 RepID=A0A7Z0D864_9ACTN|nr:hypothetical protein [Naumannella cuiyingiana]NYI70720.1 hypothetical protein [Naumannella cuiyingiana]
MTQPTPARDPETPGLRSEDIEATLSVARDQPDLTPALVDSFADRVQAEIERRSRAGELAQQNASTSAAEAAKADSTQQMVLGIVSLGVGIPLTAIAAGTTGIAGLLIAWIGIALVNMAYALRKNRRSGS